MEPETDQCVKFCTGCHKRLVLSHDGFNGLKMRIGYYGCLEADEYRDLIETCRYRGIMSRWIFAMCENGEFINSIVEILGVSKDDKLYFGEHRSDVPSFKLTDDELWDVLHAPNGKCWCERDLELQMVWWNAGHED